MADAEPNSDDVDIPAATVDARAFVKITMGTPRIGVRDYMASQHLWTARREAWLCRRRENQLVEDADGDLDRRHRSHATTAVLSAVAFLEAFINATWQDGIFQGG